jgi:molecular chaperone GrpE
MSEDEKILKKAYEKIIESKVEKDQEQEENDLGRIETLEKEKDDFKNKWLRSKADYQNLEKQSIQRVSQEILKEKLNLLLEFITIYEDFIRAQDSLSKNNVDTSGIEIIRKNMEKILSENNIVPIAAIGKPFDPQIHEAISMVEDDSVDEGTIIQEVAKGYYAEEGILKPSKVIVSKKKSEK